METERILDPLEFLRELYDEDIRYLLVGRQALVMLGAPLMTADYDFYIAPDRATLEALLAIAARRKLEHSASAVEESPLLSLFSDNLKLDFLRARRYVTKDGESFSFEDLYARKQTIPVDDFAVYVPTIEDLILTKRTRLSPRDEEDIKYLQVLLERRDAPPP
jgi:predicted nucleotidyltransferase